MIALLANSSRSSLPASHTRSCALHLLIAAVGTCVLTCPDEAHAADFFAIAHLDSKAPAVGGGRPHGTFDLCAFSHKTKGVLSGPNAVSEEQNSRNAGDTLKIDDPADKKATTDCNREFSIGKEDYGPDLKGFRDRPKPATSGLDVVESTSLALRGRAEQELFVDEIKEGGFDLSHVTVRASAIKLDIPPEGMPRGKAAGFAIDPFALDPGFYTLAPLIDISLATELRGDFAGVDYFSTDSRYSDPLWSLHVSARGLILSVDDLLIDFVSNGVLGLVDSDVEAMLRNAFMVAPGAASLTSYELFHVGYSVDRTIVYAEGVEAGISRVAEPPATSLALLGVLALGLRRFRRSR